MERLPCRKWSFREMDFRKKSCCKFSIIVSRELTCYKLANLKTKTSIQFILKICSLSAELELSNYWFWLSTLSVSSNICSLYYPTFLLGFRVCCPNDTTKYKLNFIVNAHYCLENTIPNANSYVSRLI